MAERKPWDTHGPPQRKSKSAMGRDELFKMKKVGQPKPPPKYDWRDLFQPLSKAFEKIGGIVMPTSEYLSQAHEAFSLMQQEAQAEHSLREDVLLMRHEPGFDYGR